MVVKEWEKLIRVSFWRDEKYAKIDCGNGRTTLNTLKKPLNYTCEIGELYDVWMEYISKEAVITKKPTVLRAYQCSNVKSRS